MIIQPIKLELLKRVSVVGTSCSGKTTFAKNLARILNSKHIELDAIHWLPDWVERPKDEFLDLVEKAAAADAWVFDGNYSRTREIVWRRATAVIWLNYSYSRTFYRSLNRTTRRIVSGERIYSGNRETFRQAFMSRDSILLWVLKSYHEKRRRYLKLLGEDNLSDKEIFIFRHPNQAEEFLRRVGQINLREDFN
jgi:adenylate kinase family enzyme